jgi:ribosomal protein S18 acetylase RimI-like enzyme
MRLDLTAPPPAPEWPEGVTHRTATSEDLVAVWQAQQAAFADLPTHVALDFDAWVEDRVRRDPGHDPGLWFLAEAADRIVGVCLTRPTTPEGADLGYVRDLGVLGPWRRRGIGMALLRTAFAAFRRRGLTGAALEVDDVSLDGAAALYRAAGMRIVHRTDVMEVTIPTG